MDCTKLSDALGHDPFDPWPYCDSLAPTHVDWHRERPAGNRYSPKYLMEVLTANPNTPAQHRPAVSTKRYGEQQKSATRK
jgi:hypothetical protein